MERARLHAELSESAGRERELRERVREGELQAQEAVAAATKALREAAERDQEVVVAKAEAHAQVERAIAKELIAVRSDPGIPLMRV